MNTPWCGEGAGSHSSRRMLIRLVDRLSQDGSWLSADFSWQSILSRSRFLSRAWMCLQANVISEMNLEGLFICIVGCDYEEEADCLWPADDRTA